jgi:hypothetical protein
MGLRRAQESPESLVGQIIHTTCGAIEIDVECACGVCVVCAFVLMLFFLVSIDNAAREVTDDVKHESVKQEPEDDDDSIDVDEEAEVHDDDNTNGADVGSDGDSSGESEGGAGVDAVDDARESRVLMLTRGRRRVSAHQ